MIRRSKKPSVKTLQRKLDKAFSHMIRLRDCEKPCISCGEYHVLQAGHFVPRKHLPTRWHPFNVNGECCKCNGFDGLHIIGYYKGLRRRYAGLVPEELQELAKVRWKVLACQLERLIAATKDPDEYVQVWDEIEAEFNPIPPAVDIRQPISEDQPF